MPNITEFSLNTSRLTVLFLVLVVATGILTFLDYPKREDPSIVIRDAVVTARFAGMATERVENLITRRLEEKIREMPEVDEITSDSKTGVSIVHVKIHDRYDDLDRIWQSLRNKMSDVIPELPSGTVGPTVNDEFGLTAVATIALWADGFSLAEMREVARDTRDQLYGLEGIKKIELFGIQEERIFLDLSNAKMAQFGVDPSVVVTTLQQQNIILPGGNFNIDDRNIIIEPTGNFDDIAAIESVILPIPGTDETVPLIDLVTVRRGYVDPPEKPAYFNGRPAIVVSVSIVDGVDSVDFGAHLTRRIKEIEQTLPIGYVLEYATFQPPLVEQAVDGAVNNVYQSLIIVLVVVMVFLGFRTGLIVGCFVPMAMLLGLIVMRMMDVEMQRMSIASMIIVLGMLVDSGIVVAEDIRARLEAGEDRRQAAIAAGNSLAIPLLTSTLTTILAFTPMLLAEGGTGEYTRSLGQVVTVVLLASWFLAMYMTPAMCWRFMKVKPRPGAADGAAADPHGGRFYRSYRRILETMLRFRLLVIAALIGALVLAGFAFRLVVQEFFPASDRNQFLVYLDLPAGTRADRTAEAVQALSAWLGDKTVNPEVTSTIGYVGSGGPRFFLSLAPIDPDPHLGFMVVNTETGAQVGAMVRRTRDRILAAFPDVRGRVKAMWLGATETGVVQIRVSGLETDTLLEKAEHLLARLRAIPGTVDVMHDWENRVVKLEVQVDQARARRAGITSQDVANSLRSYIDGVTITDYREGDTTIPVVVRGMAAERENLASLASINVYSSASGTIVPLGQIADFLGSGELSRIKRRDQQRTITVSAKHQFLKARDLVAELQPAIDTLELGPGYHWEMGGELENAAEAQGRLFKTMPMAFALIVVLLVWQFTRSAARRSSC